jgi:SAM-dependent methyltransferase
VLSSPAAGRNREPILQVLRERLPPRARVLEVASGSGEHAVWFAQALPEVAWRPSDADASALASIAARRAAGGPENLLEPVRLDAADPRTWPAGPFDALVCINMIHIAPWSAAEGLMRLAAQVLPAGGVLYLYGPFREGGAHTAPSNAAFDESLRARDPAWGVRDVEAVSELAEANGLAFEARVPMPANNLSLVFRRR